jgi:hypothetical protein
MKVPAFSGLVSGAEAVRTGLRGVRQAVRRGPGFTGRSIDSEELADLSTELVAVATGHDMGVDRERRGRIEVSDLGLDIGKVVSGGQEVPVATQ